MSTTLVRNPLRLSLSMISGHDQPWNPPADRSKQPLAYLFSTWSPETVAEADEDLGHYDPDSQTWEQPGGVITAGVYTRTRTSHCGTDSYCDDACF